MILWKEYQRIKDQGSDYTDKDVELLLSFCWELQLNQYELSEDLKKAADKIDQLKRRVSFYRQIHPLKGVKSASN